jgi:hypothetical protein
LATYHYVFAARGGYAGRRFEPRQAADFLEHALRLVKKVPDGERAEHETMILERLAKIYISSVRKATSK